MDNITHSLIGLMTGESYALATPKSNSGLPPAQRRATVVVLAILSNNLPDLDLLYSSMHGLRYMLEHRGYTHTILGCAALALLLYAGAAAWLKWRGARLTRGDHLTFAGVALAGVALHLGMDALNSYGVHPFWPLDNRWMYGDSVFIVEPWYWAAAAPLIFGLRTRVARIILGVLLAAAVAVCAVSGLVAEPIPILFALLVWILLGVGRRIGPRAAAAVSVTMFVVVTLGFIAAGRTATARVTEAVLRDFPDDRLLDHVLSPMPANPLCWDVLALEVHGDQYVARHAALSLAPSLLTAETCGRHFLDRPTVTPQVRLKTSPLTGMEWREFSMPRALLADLGATHCDAAALLRFARAPFAIPASAGWQLGDLRFDRGRSLGFSDVHAGIAPDTGACPWTPPWVPPREDLLLQ